MTLLAHPKHHHNYSVLRIVGVTKDDLGRYGCHAENSLGRHELNITLIYEPEPAILNECKLTDDLQTVVCNWTVYSAQPVSEATLFFKQNNEHKWQDSVQSEIRRGDGNMWE